MAQVPETEDEKIRRLAFEAVNRRRKAVGLPPLAPKPKSLET